MDISCEKELNNNIRNNLVEKETTLVAFGIQSNGISSTVESIVGFAFPNDRETEIDTPIKVVMRHSDREYARIKFEKENHYEEQNDNLPSNDITDKILQFRKIVKEKYNVRDGQFQIFDDVIQIDIFKKNTPNFTIYDLPGLSFNEKINKNIIKKYLEKEETKVLFILSGIEEITNNFAVYWLKFNLDCFKNYEERFYPVITKVDMCHYKNIDFEFYLNEIETLKKLGFKNKPSLIANKLDEIKEKIFIVNHICKDNRYLSNDSPVYIGRKELINHIIETQ